jgi:hypothetical protein
MGSMRKLGLARNFDSKNDEACSRMHQSQAIPWNPFASREGLDWVLRFEQNLARNSQSKKCIEEIQVEINGTGKLTFYDENDFYHA